LSGIFSSVTASEAWFVMLEKISDSNVCSRRLRREQTWSNAQLGIRAAAGGANDLNQRWLLAIRWIFLLNEAATRQKKQN